MAKEFAAYTENQPITGTASVEDTTVTLDVVGKGAHGASPQSGINAATFLAGFLDGYDFAGGAKNFLHVTGAYLHEDFYGEKLTVAYEDAKMGKLTMNAGLFDFDAAQEKAFINLNFRYPQGTTLGKIEAALNTAIGEYGVTISVEPHHMTPHYVPQEDPLVATLLSVYEDHTGEKGFEQIIGGGTYGRLLKRGVAYGAMFPGYTDTMHQANEFMDLDDLFRAAVIYADAIYRLAK